MTKLLTQLVFSGISKSHKSGPSSGILLSPCEQHRGPLHTMLCILIPVHSLIMKFQGLFKFAFFPFLNVILNFEGGVYIFEIFGFLFFSKEGVKGLCHRRENKGYDNQSMS
jgi:hypothetical protein